MGDNGIDESIHLSGQDKKVAKYIEEQIDKYNRRAALARKKVQSLSSLAKKIDKQKTMQATMLRQFHEDDSDSKYFVHLYSAHRF